MSTLTRHQCGQKVAKIGTKLALDRSGFLPEKALDIRMMEAVEDLPDDLAEAGIQSINWGGGLFTDYDSYKFMQGEYTKEYKYRFIIPYESPQKGQLRPFMCDLHFKKWWYKDEKIGSPELQGSFYCDTSRDSEKEIFDELASSGLEFAKKDGKWGIRTIKTGEFWTD